jgi:hypothetical protein
MQCMLGLGTWWSKNNTYLKSKIETSWFATVATAVNSVVLMRERGREEGCSIEADATVVDSLEGHEACGSMDIHADVYSSTTHANVSETGCELKFKVISKMLGAQATWALLAMRRYTDCHCSSM